MRDAEEALDLLVEHPHRVDPEMVELIGRLRPLLAEKRAHIVRVWD
jgi:hypothetical protein